MSKPLYTAEVHVSGGREGRAESSDGMLDVRLDRPRALGGREAGVNPEQLFAAAYGACLESACRLVARRRNVAIRDSSVRALVSLGERAAGGFEIEARLFVRLEGPTPEQAREILKEAHETICPFSHATRGAARIEVALETE